MRALLHALDERTGLLSRLRRSAERPIPGGASWAYVLGFATLVLFAVLFVTGAALAAFYSPSTTEAWPSLVYLEREVPLGALLRAIHAHAHSGIMILALLHLLQVVLYGAYRAPREATWLTGLLLLGLLPVFSLTGYLLPYDQLAYWATKVRMGIVSAPPVIGPWIPPLLLGGNDVGALSLTRFYALHVVVLPIVALALVVVHRALSRRHGPAPHPGRSPSAIEAATEPYWPRQATFDAGFSLVVVVAVVALAARWSAPLDAPADPAQPYIARPEWYFLSIFQLLKYFHGPLEVVGKVVVPGLAAASLAALPFLDRAPSRRARDRRGVIGAFAAALLGAVLLTGLAVGADARDALLQEQHAIARDEAARARALAAAGVPPEGPAFMLSHDPPTRGARVFRKACLSCHPVGDHVPEKLEAPELTGYLSRAWLRQVLRDPDSHRLYGKTKVEGMEPVEASPEDLDRLVAYLHRLREDPPPSAETASVAALIDEHDCDNCHDFEEEYGADGPTLFRYGARPWVRQVIARAEHEAYYGAENSMPAFDTKLSEEDLEAVTTYVLALENTARPGRWPLVDEPAPTPRVPTSSTATIAEP